MKALLQSQTKQRLCSLPSLRNPSRQAFTSYRNMSTFPPKELRAIVTEVTGLLKERKESVSVAETVCLSLWLRETKIAMLPCLS